MESSNAFNINGILNSAVLTGKVTGEIWTGLPSSKYINSFLCQNSSKQTELLRRVQDIEDKIKQLRDLQTSKNIITTANTNLILLMQEIKNELEYVIRRYEYWEFNSDIFAVYLIRTYEEILKTNSEELKSIRPQTLTDIRKFEGIVNSQEPIITLTKYSESKKRAVVTPIVTIEQDKKMSYKKNKEKLKRFVALYTGNQNPTEQDIIDTLNKLNEVLMSTDAFSLYKDGDLANRLYDSTFYNYLIDMGVPIEKIVDLEPREVLEMSTNEYSYNTKEVESHAKLQTGYLMSSLEYVDLDKLFLLYVGRNLNFLEEMKIDLSTAGASEKTESGTIVGNSSGGRSKTVDVDEVLVYFKEVYERLQKIIATKMIPKSTKVHILRNSQDQEISLEESQNLMKNFCAGVYLSPDIKKYMVYMIYSKNIDGAFENQELVKRLEFSDEDFVQLALTDAKDLKELYNNKVIDKQFLLRIIKKLSQNDIQAMPEFLKDKNWSETIIEEIQETRSQMELTEFLSLLKTESILDISDFKSAYEDGIIEFEALENIGYEDKEFETLVSDEELINAYRIYTDCLLEYQKDGSNESKQRLEKARSRKDRVLVFYRKFKLNKLDKDEKTENAGTLILNYYSNLDSKNADAHIAEALREMYKDGVVNFESILGADEAFLKTVIIDKMLKRGELSLDDTVSLRDTVSFGEIRKIVEEALKDATITENEKFVLVMNMFHRNTLEDSKARAEYLNRFKYKSYSGNIEGVNSGDLTTELDIPKKKLSKENAVGESQKYAYPDYVKWIFFHSLDKETQVKKYANGYVEFYLPKFDRRIIEKYYDVDYYSKKIKGEAYGVSTYIVSDSKYRDFQEELIDTLPEGDAINEKMLRLVVNKQDRVRHNTHSLDKNWMKSLVGYLGYL